MTNIYEVSEKVFKLEQQGKHIIKFNIGDPDQSTDARIIDACNKAMKEGMTKYGPGAGEMALRKRIAEDHGVKPENVFITPGSKFAIFAAMDTLLKKGDNLVMPSPHWSAYELAAKAIGAETHLVKTSMKDGWKADPSKIEAAINDKTKLIILSNPSNPTSMITDEKTLESLVEIAAKHKVPILSDECYGEIAFKKVKSMTEFGVDNICVRSFSKTFAMTGWRVGYAIANEELVKRFVKVTQYTISNVAPFVQYAALKALDLKDEIAGEMRKIYKKRAETVCSMLAKTKLEFCKPEAPFYLFPYCGEDSEKVTLELIDKGVAITPGTAFGDFKEYFRLALTIPDGEIKSGTEIIAKQFAKA